jgi:hypothetical protein
VLECVVIKKSEKNIQKKIERRGEGVNHGGIWVVLSLCLNL